MSIVGPGNITSFVGAPFGMTRAGLNSIGGITIFHWFRNNNTNPSAAFAAEGAGFFNSAQNYEFHTIFGLTAWYGDEEDNTGADYDATINDTMTQFIWYPIMITAKGDGTRYAYDIITGAKTADTNVAASTTAYTHFGIGYSPAVDSAFGFNWDATTSIAEVAVWSGELSINDWTLLKSGVNPLTIERNRLMMYFPLNGNLSDLGPLGLALQPSGTNCNFTWSDHPNVQALPRKRILKPSPVIVSPSSYSYMNYPFA